MFSHLHLSGLRLTIIITRVHPTPRQLKAREAEDALRAREELSGCRPDGGPPKPPPPGGGGGSGGGAGVSAVAATVAKAAVNVVDLPPMPPMPPMPPPPSYSSAANPLLLNELTSSPPALNDRTPVSEIKITVLRNLVHLYDAEKKLH